MTTAVLAATRRRRRVLVALPAAAVTAVAVAAAMDRSAFTPYVGSVPPVLAAALVALVGVGALRFLDDRGWSVAGEPSSTRRGIRTAAALAVAFAAVVVPADLLLGYPADINVPWPTSVVFYPAIGVMAEVVFHALPVALLELVRGRGRGRRTLTIPVVIGLAALVEPTFQVLAAEDASAALLVFTGLHLYAFNLAELVLFRRHDLLSMYALRLSYYLLWHIAWGTLRLDLVAG